MLPVLPKFMCGLCDLILTEPKGLPCHHEFCCACLKAHCIKTGSGSEFPCPTCEKKVALDTKQIPLIELPDEIPTNLIKKKQLEKVHLINDLKYKHVCGFCFTKWKTNPATKFCRSCEEYFCNECGNQHWLLRSSKEHRIWLLADIKALNVDPYIRANLALMFNARIKHTTKPDDPDFIDFKKCRVTGASFLPDGRLAVLDSNNEKLKLFDKSLIFRSQEKVLGHDVLVVNKTLLVVTCPELNNLIYFTTSQDGFKKENVIETENKCYGLTYKDFNSFYTATAGARVTLIEYQRTTVFDEIVVSPGRISMNFPHYLAYSMTNETFCISDLSSKCIKSVSKTGDVLWERKVNDCGAVISFADYFLLGRQDRKTVDIIRPDGQLLKSFLTTNDALSSVIVLSADTWKIDIGKVRVAVIDDTDLVYIYTPEDPLSELDWYPHSRGNHISQQASNRSTENLSRFCNIV